MKKHVFTAGPCLLPEIAVEKAIEGLKDFAGTGVPVLSISHRTKEWIAVMDECRSLWRELLHIPETHEVVFMSGGASMQFLCVAMNFLENKAAYLDTGRWSQKAFDEAYRLSKTSNFQPKEESENEVDSKKVYKIASSLDRNYSYIPKDFNIPEDIDYLHITTNNTIYGTEIKKDLDSPVPLIADMSSDILSRPVDVSKYALIYGGAQKNAGPAGVGFAIIQKDALGKVSRYIPNMLNYQIIIDNESMYNTPPVFPIYVMFHNLRWLKSQGGVEAIHKINLEKAELLYSEIDRNSSFRGTAAKEDRSIMNVCFVIDEEADKKYVQNLQEDSESHGNLEEEFLKYAADRNIVGIKGHRTAGGFRASIYNACSLEDVEALVSCMKDFEKEVLKRF